jgi:hypothetical protein
MHSNIVFGVEIRGYYEQELHDPTQKKSSGGRIHL